jgi:hypothetical protein
VIYKYTDGEYIEDIFLIRITVKLVDVSLPSLINFYSVCVCVCVRVCVCACASRVA